MGRKPTFWDLVGLQLARFIGAKDPHSYFTYILPTPNYFSIESSCRKHPVGRMKGASYKGFSFLHTTPIKYLVGNPCRNITVKELTT